MYYDFSDHQSILYMIKRMIWYNWYMYARISDIIILGNLLKSQHLRDDIIVGGWWHHYVGDHDNHISLLKTTTLFIIRKFQSSKHVGYSLSANRFPLMWPYSITRSSCVTIFYHTCFLCDNILCSIMWPYSIIHASYVTIFYHIISCYVTIFYYTALLCDHILSHIPVMWPYSITQASCVTIFYHTAFLCDHILSHKPLVWPYSITQASYVTIFYPTSLLCDHILSHKPLVWPYSITQPSYMTIICYNVLHNPIPDDLLHLQH